VIRWPCIGCVQNLRFPKSELSIRVPPFKLTIKEKRSEVITCFFAHPQFCIRPKTLSVVCCISTYLHLLVKLSCLLLTNPSPDRLFTLFVDYGFILHLVEPTQLQLYRSMLSSCLLESLTTWGRISAANCLVNGVNVPSYIWNSQTNHCDYSHWSNAITNRMQ
jgi:hypothetical protein